MHDENETYLFFAYVLLEKLMPDDLSQRCTENLGFNCVIS